MDTRSERKQNTGRNGGEKKTGILVAVVIVLCFCAIGFLCYGFSRPAEVSLEPGYVTLLPGTEYKLMVKVRPEKHKENIKFYSTDESVATVDGEGTITAIASGRSEISAEFNGDVKNKAVCIVNVEKYEEPEPVPSVQPEDGSQDSLKYIPEEIEAPSTERTGAKIMLTGDLMCLSAQISTAGSGGAYDFTPSFALVKDIFSGADYVAGNLETTVAQSFPYAQPNPPVAAPEEAVEGAPAPSPQKYIPVLNAPEEYLYALSDAGFDAVATAGNHCCDTGAQGIRETITALEAQGLAYTGTFADAAAPRFLMADVNGIKVAFLSYSEFFNGKDGALTSEERAYMINPYSKERVENDVAGAKDAGAQFIIAYDHWGTENKQTVDQSQKEHAKVMADAGVNVIVGAHPHCLQEAEYITADDGRSVLCLYSMGNFVSSMAQQMHNDTAIAEINIVKDGEHAFLESAGYIPCRVSDHGGKSFVVQPVEPDSDAGKRIGQAIGSELAVASQ